MDIATWSLVFSVVAAVAACVAAVIEVLERRERRRQTYSRFSVKNIGTISDAGDGKQAELVELVQFGTVSASIVFANLYGATFHPTEKNRLPPVMLPGQTALMNIRSDNLENAFILILWIDSAWNIGIAEWLPITRTGPLANKLSAQIDEDMRSRWRRAPWTWLRKESRRIGPEGVRRRRLPRPGRESADKITAMLPEGTFVEMM